MKIEYKGINKKEDRQFSEAWISYDEDNKKEEEKVDLICEIIKLNGWKPECESGFVVIRVSDRNDYEYLASIYKKAKKKVLKSKMLEKVIESYNDGYTTLEGVYNASETDLDFYLFLKYNECMDEDDIKETMCDVTCADDSYYNALSIAEM